MLMSKSRKRVSPGADEPEKRLIMRITSLDLSPGVRFRRRIMQLGKQRGEGGKGGAKGASVIKMLQLYDGACKIAKSFPRMGLSSRNSSRK